MGEAPTRPACCHPKGGSWRSPDPGGGLDGSAKALPPPRSGGGGGGEEVSRDW